MEGEERGYGGVESGEEGGGFRQWRERTKEETERAKRQEERGKRKERLKETDRKTS